MKDSVLSKISWGFAKKYRITIIIWALILLFGGLSYTTFLKKEGFPAVNLPIAVVQGTYFADDSKQVDQKVVSEVSAAVEDLEIVDEYQAISGDNFYTLIVTFNNDVEVEEGTRQLDDKLVQDVQLPKGAEQTVSAIDPSKFNNQYNLLLAVYDKKDSDYKYLANKAQKIADELVATSEIESAQAIKVQEQVTNPITGQPVERQTSINKIAIEENGEIVYYPAISIGVTKADGVDAIELSDAVKESLESSSQISGLENINTTITADFAKTIDQQLANLQSSLMTGLVAVVVVALLLISWRAAIVIAMFIPIVVAATLSGLFAAGITLNTITLFAIILTLGLFVDDATIIVESIDAHRTDKKSHKEIIKGAVGRVGIASLAGTLTTMLVFAPMLFVSGILGSFIRLLPITVMLSLALSFAISIVIVPFISRLLVLSGSGKKGFLDKLSILVPVETWISTRLAKLPLINKRSKRKGLAVSALMVGISLLAIMGAGKFASGLRMDIFPESKDSDVLLASVEFAPGTSIEQAEDITDKIDQNIVEAAGDNLEYVTYLSANERSAEIEIGLIPYTERDTTSHQVVEALEQTGDVAGAVAKYSQRDAGPPDEDFPFQMRVYAPSEKTLKVASEQIQEFISDQSFDVAGGQTSVAEVKTDDDTINRTEQGRYVTILARFDNDDLTSQAAIELENSVKSEFNEGRLAELSLAKDSLDFDVSQESENADSFNSIGVGLLAALALMYLLLVLLFNSFSQPLLIFVAIPFSLFGVFWGLTVTDNSMSFFVMLGLLGLIGIVVNNSILLTEYANQEKEKGLDRHQAISNAVKDRFRPLVTTTLTTIFALLPLALSDPFWQPLAYTLIFGMASSTILIILSFPYYYLMLERVRDFKNRKLPALK